MSFMKPKTETKRRKVGKSNDRKKPRGMFETILGQRNVNLEQQKKLLRLAKARLQRDIDEVDMINTRIAQQENELDNFEEDINSQEKTSSFISISPDIKSEVKHQYTVLIKTEADLKQAIKQVRLEIEEANMTMKTTQSDLDAMSIQEMEQQLQEKIIIVQVLKELVDSMNMELLTRENEVMALELDAVQHHKLVKEMMDEKQELEDRKMRLMEEKAELDRENEAELRRSQRLSEKHGMLECQLNEALLKREHLMRYEMELEELYVSVERRRKEAAEAKTKMTEDKISFVSEQIASMEANERDIRDSYRSHLESKFKEEEEMAELETSLEIDEREWNSRIADLEAEDGQTQSMWNAKRERVQSMIDSVSATLGEMQNKEEIEQEIQKQQEDNNKLREIVQAKKAEIDELKKNLMTREEVESKMQEMTTQLADVMAQEQELRRELLRLEAEESDIMTDEARLKIFRTEVETEKLEIEKRNDLVKQMMDVHQRQLESAQEEYPSTGEA